MIDTVKFLENTKTKTKKHSTISYPAKISFTNESEHTHTNMFKWFLTKVQKQFEGESQTFQKMVLEELHTLKQKNEPWPKPHTLYRN